MTALTPRTSSAAQLLAQRLRELASEVEAVLARTELELAVHTHRPRHSAEDRLDWLEPQVSPWLLPSDDMA